jgi:hypothetical protein
MLPGWRQKATCEGPHKKATTLPRARCRLAKRVAAAKGQSSIFLSEGERAEGQQKERVADEGHPL